MNLKVDENHELTSRRLPVSAAFCARAAGLAENADHKKHIEQLAQQWLKMAKQFEASELNVLLT
jgi:hypothetical protein